MKNLVIILLLPLFAGCYLVRKSPQEKRAVTQCQGTYANLDSAVACAKLSKKLLLVAVFNANDSALYHAPITQTLKLDSIKDKSYIYVLNRDYVVVKLVDSEAKRQIKNMTKNELNERFINAATSNTQTWFCITGTSLYMLWEWDKQTGKDMIIDHIWVGAGP